MERGLHKDIVNGVGPAGVEVARRMVAAVRALDAGDEEAAAGHAAVARRLGVRLAPVREAVGVIAYELGEYDTALRDLRAAHRMSGAGDLLPLIADCERAAGRPERALEVAASREGRSLDIADRIELLIVAAGARNDMGQHGAAVETLRVPQLDLSSPQPWQERLWFAYADALVRAGRDEEAQKWFGRAAAHPAQETDARQRLAVTGSVSWGVRDDGQAEEWDVVDLDGD